MTPLENKSQEETDEYYRHSLRKWEERVFGIRYEESKNFFPIVRVKSQTALSMHNSQNKWSAVINAKPDI